MERRISRGTRMMGWREEEFFVSMVVFFYFWIWEGERGVGFG